MAAFTALHALTLYAHSHHNAAALNVLAATSRTTISVLPRRYIRVRRSPRTNAVIDLLKETNILRVILPHDAPASFIARHAAEPQMRACVRQLRANAKITSKIIKLIRVKLKMPSSNLKGINRAI